MVVPLPPEWFAMLKYTYFVYESPLPRIFLLNHYHNIHQYVRYRLVIFSNLLARFYSTFYVIICILILFVFLIFLLLFVYYNNIFNFVLIMEWNKSYQFILYNITSIAMVYKNTVVNWINFVGLLICYFN